MLKHCTPTSESRRRRKAMEDGCGAEDILSLGSSSSSSVSGTSDLNTAPSTSVLCVDKTCGPASNVALTYKDASTSPYMSAKSHKGRIPLAIIARQNLKKAEAMALPKPVNVAIKVYAKCLRSDIEYKTLSITATTTAKEVIWMLLSKYRMKHRDPKLFYLTMDISIKRTGIPLRKSLSLDDDSKPVELKSCHPWGECKFSLQMRKGGVIR